MDKELAEALRDQRELTSAGFIRLEAIIDRCREDAQKHYLEDARMFAKMEGSTTAIHERLDEHIKGHLEDRKTRVQLWTGVVLAVLGSIGSMVVSLFGGRTK